MLIHFTNQQIAETEERKRTALVNSLSGFKSLNLIGTVNKDGQTNLAVFNSVMHIGANPPLMGFISRPDSVERHTLENIQQTGYYTINHVNKEIFEKAHQTSARYKREQSEFDASGLTAEYKNNFSAPFVQESSIQIGLILKEIVSVKSNGTHLIVGEITDLYFPEEIWEETGILDIEKAGTVAGSSLDGYHTTQLLKRMKYAKP
ncbi:MULTISPECIES: flavin reductase family protein [unclassified Chryseobacterium]|uniref:flavin reductase family protein n=1 Tax=unclassified Chryseobacterium TaxID=2593645 RepID=UPI000D3CBDD1|nr:MULTISPECIES: flavin reductase family protein [unclassified Chryseobacterium]PTT75037.1 flavin oxidoreductase [Chryseobacterium sp. HMWF001]PVV61626.1 flavin reductase family protein [Chryseobacterium sp. HMWF035]